MVRHTVALLVALAASQPASSHAVTLTPSNALVIDFRIATLPPSEPPSGPYDILALAYGVDFTSTADIAGQKAALFDGETLLGVHESSDPRAFYWKAAGSPFTYDAPTEVSFSTLLDGSINGRIRVTLGQGSASFDESRIELIFGQTRPGNSIATAGGTFPQITAVRVVPIPEPDTSALLLIGGLIVLGAARAARQRR